MVNTDDVKDFFAKYGGMIIGIVTTIAVGFFLWWMWFKGVLGILIGMGAMAYLMLTKNVFVRSLFDGTQKEVYDLQAKQNDTDKTNTNNKP